MGSRVHLAFRVIATARSTSWCHCGSRAARRVVVLGCGPGHLTRQALARRWPGAVIEALTAHRDGCRRGRNVDLTPITGDLRDWKLQSTPMVVVAPPCYWVPEHSDLLVLVGRRAG